MELVVGSERGNSQLRYGKPHFTIGFPVNGNGLSALKLALGFVL